MFPVASLATLNLNVGGLPCALPVPTTAASLALPVIVGALLLACSSLAFVASGVHGALLERSRLPALVAVLDKLKQFPLRVRVWSWGLSAFNLLLAHLAVAYVLVVRAALEALQCVDVLGTRVLASDSSVECSGSAYSRRRAVSVALAALYGVGVPVLFVALLHPYRYGFTARIVVNTHRWANPFPAAAPQHSYQSMFAHPMLFSLPRVMLRTDQRLRIQGKAGPIVTTSPFFFLQHKLSALYSDYRASCLLWAPLVS